MKRSDKNKRQGTRPEHTDDYATFEFEADIASGLYTVSQYWRALREGYDLMIDDDRAEWFLLHEDVEGDDA